jgi:hypothetical protein
MPDVRNELEAAVLNISNLFPFEYRVKLIVKSRTDFPGFLKGG